MTSSIKNRTIFYCLLCIVYLASCNSSPQKANGDIVDDFESAMTETNNEAFTKFKDSLLSIGWKDEHVKNGIMPNCYNYVSVRDTIQNYLKVNVGSGTDVAIKVMELETDKCIRFVFINSNSTYKIENIPQGRYYVKIAYGKNWMSKTEKGFCEGKFISSPLYERGDEIMDYNLIRLPNGYNVPSFELSLDVISNSPIDEFSSSTISEEEFNK